MYISEKFGDDLSACLCSVGYFMHSFPRVDLKATNVSEDSFPLCSDKAERI